MGKGAIADPTTGKSQDGNALGVLLVSIVAVNGILIAIAISWLVGTVAAATAGVVSECSLLHPLMIAQAVAGVVTVLIRPLFFSCPTLLYTEVLNPLPRKDNYP